MKAFLKSLISKRLPRGILPKIDLPSLIPCTECQLTVIEPAVANGNVNLYELLAMVLLVRGRQPKALFEIGTFDGRTTLNLAANSSREAHIHTLDLPSSGLDQTRFNVEELDRKLIDKPVSGSRFLGRPEQSKITQLYGDSARFDFSPYFNQMDLVFVDASHAYEYVLNDSRIALKLLRQGKGTILWHDYDRPEWWPGVMKALDELYTGSPGFSGLRQIEGTSLACLMAD